MQALGPLNRARAGLGKKAEAKRGVEESIALGKAFGELGMALQAAAGVAMHLGYGERVLTLAEQIIERNRETGINADEAYVLLALAHCQLGDADAAMAAIEHVEVDDFPFGLGARALVRAVGGEHDGALADAEALEHVRGTSYFDLALGRLGGVLAAQRGDDADVERHWLERFDTLVASVGDVGFLAVAQRLHGRADDETTMEAAALAPGWRRIVDSVVVG